MTDINFSTIIETGQAISSEQWVHLLKEQKKQITTLSHYALSRQLAIFFDQHAAHETDQNNKRQLIKDSLRHLSEALNPPSRLKRALNKISDSFYWLTTLGTFLLVTLGTVFAFDTIGFSTAWEIDLSYVIGGTLATAITYNLSVSRQFKLKSNDELANSKLMKKLMRDTIILAALSLLMIGIFLSQAASILSLGAPFGLSGLTASIVGYTILVLAAVTGGAKVAANMSMYAQLKKLTHGESSSVESSETLPLTERPGFKSFLANITLLGSVAAMLFTGLLVMSVILPPGLGFAIGLVLGAASLFKKYISVKKKVGGLTNDSFLDRMILNFEKNYPRAFKLFNIITSVLAAAAIFFASFVALPHLAANMAFELPEIVPLICGIVLGIAGALASLLPGYNATKNTVNAAQLDSVLKDEQEKEATGTSTDPTALQGDTQGPDPKGEQANSYVGMSGQLNDIDALPSASKLALEQVPLAKEAQHGGINASPAEPVALDNDKAPVSHTNSP